ncbi:MAG TPA: cation:proton antiporter [Ornithinibacter sp.]|nr:cation:proton antiporter [Ornithinibacter sp.]
MGTMAVVVFLVLVLAFAATARALGRLDVSAPMAFVVAGAGLSLAAPALDEIAKEGLTLLTEMTLALILFHDAAQVRPRRIAADRGLVARLLLVGLPLTMAAGWLLGVVLFPGLPTMMLLLLAAAVAPTDAGLGAATVLNPVVPVRVRRMLNVESGLNDGLCTPFVLFAIAALAGEEGLGPVESIWAALGDLAVGIAVGIAVGAGAGLILGWSREHGLSSRHTRPLAALVLPVIAYFGAELAGGNAFVAAFVAGSAFAGVARWAEEEETLELTEALADPLGFAVWFAFGFIAVPVLVENVGWAEVTFSVLALTLLRMVPVALALLGTGLRAPTVAFVGWFGPRGLASVVFTLLALEALELDANLTRVVATICLTVLLSVLAHGFSADPLSARYGAWAQRTRPTQEMLDSIEPRSRRSLHRRSRERDAVPPA